jgi:hypothetical protein
MVDQALNQDVGARLGARGEWFRHGVVPLSAAKFLLQYTEIDSGWSSARQPTPDTMSGNSPELVPILTGGLGKI